MQVKQSSPALVLTVILSIMVSIGSFFLLTHFFGHQDDALMPPVLVVDYAQIVQHLPDDEMESEAIMIKTSELIARFHDAGFLVLDAQNVIAAPSTLYLPLEAVYEQK